MSTTNKGSKVNTLKLNQTSPPASVPQKSPNATNAENQKESGTQAQDFAEIHDIISGRVSSDVGSKCETTPRHRNRLSDAFSDKLHLVHGGLPPRGLKTVRKAQLFANMPAPSQ